MLVIVTLDMIKSLLIISLSALTLTCSYSQNDPLHDKNASQVQIENLKEGNLRQEQLLLQFKKSLLLSQSVKRQSLNFLRFDFREQFREMELSQASSLLTINPIDSKKEMQ